ncbi:hypothetical protein TVAG_397320 [Trichomonas vaginalis G3]|uniref:Uncharacterized protein n=1 Tax=Trichomonas vaginalis (strain ATCC PRA-98 / G3) TaxID=412133 RepID=A2DXB9_TRIV3|nr:8-oxo-dGTP phosphohydrolase protein [Trichomonas vaginalis G3]EAY15001.1 hypothetical protein TVAG_397320 [Trichomonas vaginalis G3]KAI5507319.1 8-oxo-dGTP phosphohydrolase protein [Trichomonas vaginalis G3]|eukprot:XP_001327224.1 hypothetical protein [Trichomonas vaginalis G3]
MILIYPLLAVATKVLIFDAGSSGTRVYLYQYKDSRDPSTYEAVLDEKGQQYNYKAQIKLSDVAKNESIMDDIYTELLTNKANNWIPETERPDVPLMIYATAGMRLLSKEDQTKVLKIAYTKAKNNFKYKINEKYFRVIEGYEEGIYAWISVNKLRNAIGTEEKTLPILEIGGASVQFASQVNGKIGSYLNSFVKKIRIGKEYYNVFAYSWLGFGSDVSGNTVNWKAYNDSSKTPCTIKGKNYSVKTSDGKIEVPGNPDFDKCYNYFSDQILKKDSKENCGGFECIFKDERENKCVPLPEKFDKLYGLGVLNYEAGYFKLKTFDLNTFKNESFKFGNYSAAEAESIFQGNPFLSSFYSQQLLIINFLSRGFGSFIDSVTINAQRKINNAEPQWTLGAVLEAGSAASIGLQWYFILLIVLAIIIIIVVIIIIIVCCACKKDKSHPSDNDENEDSGSGVNV